MALLGKKQSYGGYAFLIGLALSVILAVVGTGVGAMQPYLMAGVATLGFVVVLLNISMAEGQKFLLWIIAAGVTGYLTLQGVFAGIGLQIVEQVLMGFAVFFGSIAMAGVIVQGYKLSSKK